MLYEVITRQEALQATAAAADGETLVAPCDVADAAAVERMFEATVQRFGRVDVLVCNAASNPYYGPMSGTAVPSLVGPRLL